MVLMVKWHGHSPRPAIEGIVRVEARLRNTEKVEVLWAQPVLLGRRRIALARAHDVLERELDESDYYSTRYEDARITYEETEGLA